MGSSLAVHSEVADQPDAARIAELIVRTAKSEGATLPAISVSFVTPDTIRAQNLQYRGIDRATDILSYPFDDSFPGGAGGELIVCPELARSNATQAGHPLQTELDLLIVHGTLHLLGYEDETERGRRSMDAKTKAVLDGLQEAADG